MYKLLKTIPALLTILLLAACAGRGGVENGMAAGPGEVTIEVENNAATTTTLQVTAVPESGTTSILGTVLPAATSTFTFDPLQNTGSYNLVARPTVPGAAQIVSAPITTPSTGGPMMVTWDIATNSLSYGQ